MTKRSKKSIVITGCSSGIGEDTAKLFAQKDWIVFAGVRKQSDADLLSSYNQNIKPLILDVTNEEQVKKAFGEVRAAVGADGLDALVNNAGFARVGPVELTPMNKIQDQFEVNVFGVIRVTQAALPLLRIGSPGRIVNVSSVAGNIVPPIHGIYCGTKKALDCISESMRRELAEWGIKVSVLKPGPVKTNIQNVIRAMAVEFQDSFPDGSRGNELYGKQMKSFPSIIEKVEKMGVAEPSASSLVIYKALTVKNPRNFYWDTWGSANKSIVITGCSSGIGEDTAKLFALKGWTVFACVRKESDAERLSSYDQNIKPLILDVTNQEQIDRAFEKVKIAVGTNGLDALVNNAGIGYIAPMEFFPINKVQQQFDVNVFGIIRVTQAALPLLRIGSPGRIVNVSSIVPESSFALFGMYSGSKKALDCISESMRRELSEWGIRVSVLKPGPVKTPICDTAMNHALEMQQTIPVGSKGEELYGTLTNGVLSVIKAFENIGIADPSASSSVIYEAITSKNPRNFYWDTWGTWINATITGLLPTWMVDKALSSLFKAN
eukprot:g3442.t1